MIAEWLERFRNGDRRALARLLTLAARGEHVAAIRVGLPRVPAARVVALTGAGGVGKSSLTGALISAARAVGRRVAVLACDPQSPLSGGALLGDRFRMPSHHDDDAVFVRSLATAGGQGAIAGQFDLLIALVEAFGFDAVIVETVGAGQGDTSVRALVDVLVLLVQPETGDDVQWEKAGVLEVADLVVIHKADLPGADRVAAGVEASLSLSPHTPQVLRASARTGQGVRELWRAIEDMPGRRAMRTDPARLLRVAHDLLTARFNERDPIVTDWQRGALDDATAAQKLLERLTP